MSVISTVHRIALQNKSSKKIGFDDLAKLAPALQIQVDRDFFHVWGKRAQIFPMHKGDPVPSGVWPIFFIDPKDEPGGVGSGVHMDKDHKPFAFTTDADEYTITASHELLEMLVDPFGNKFTHGPDIDPSSDGHLVSYLEEVGDPCEVFSYTIDSIAVSDFD